MHKSCRKLNHKEFEIHYAMLNNIYHSLETFRSRDNKLIRFTFLRSTKSFIWYVIRGDSVCVFVTNLCFKYIHPFCYLEILLIFDLWCFREKMCAFNFFVQKMVFLSAWLIFISFAIYLITFMSNSDPLQIEDCFLFQSDD